MPVDATTEPPVPSRNAFLLGILCFVLGFIPILIWPTEVMWLIDEPRLLANAWHANASHELAVEGLTGNFGVPYSPVPTQIYQLILACTHDPAKIVIFHALLNGGLISLALLWLARSLRFPPWFGAAFLFAPYISLQQRVLWDASFTLPFGMLAVAGLASFLRTGGKWPLRLAVVMAIQVFLVHPQALPVGIPILFFLFWQHRPALHADRRGLLYTLAVLVTCNAKYFFIAKGAVIWRLTHGGGTTYPGAGSRLESMFAPIFGGNLLNGYDHCMMLPTAPFPWPNLFTMWTPPEGWFFPPATPMELISGWFAQQGTFFSQSPWLFLAMWATKLVYLFIWLGILLALVRAPRIWRAWRAKNAAVATSVTDQVATVLFAGLVFQFLLYTAARIPLGPQYYFGTFALHAFFAWYGVAFIHRHLLGKAAAIAYLAGCATVTVSNLLHSHYYLNQQPHWPTMGDTMRLTQALNAYSDEQAYIMADDPKRPNRPPNAHERLPESGLTFIYRFPQSLRTMRLLLPPEPGRPQKFSGRLLLTYVEKDGQRTGEMIVTEFTGPKPPKEAQPMEITPLTKYWLPDPSTW